MKYPVMAHKKNQNDCSKKLCCCGSHSANDKKKCKNHHATYIKLKRRQAAKMKRRIG